MFSRYSSCLYTGLQHLLSLRVCIDRYMYAILYGRADPSYLVGSRLVWHLSVKQLQTPTQNLMHIPIFTVPYFHSSITLFLPVPHCFWAFPTFLPNNLAPPSASFTLSLFFFSYLVFDFPRPCLHISPEVQAFLPEKIGRKLFFFQRCCWQHINKHIKNRSLRP